MVAFAPVSAFSGVSVRSFNQAVSTRPVSSARVAVQANIHEGPGKGFGGGEATRDPNPTRIDPNDPKGKQKAIHAASTWEEYQARQKGGSVGGASSSAPTASSSSSGTAVTWAEYQAKKAREGAGGGSAGSSWGSASSAPRGGTVGSSYNAQGAPAAPSARGGSVGGRAAPAKSFNRGSAPTSSGLDTLYGPGKGSVGGAKRGGGGGGVPASSSSVSTSVNTLYSAGGGAPGGRPSGGAAPAPRSAAPASPRGGTVGSSYASPAANSVHVHEGPGKGFGGGEATRDPNPTRIDPNDPKGKQKAIHRADSWADYQARQGGR